jgi:hypothetical protein
MAQLHKSGVLDIKPDIISYTSVINCWAKSGSKEAPDAALKLFRTTQQQYLARRQLFKARYNKERRI